MDQIDGAQFLCKSDLVDFLWKRISTYKFQKCILQFENAV